MTEERIVKIFAEHKYSASKPMIRAAKQAVNEAIEEYRNELNNLSGSQLDRYDSIAIADQLKVK